MSPKLYCNRSQYFLEQKQSVKCWEGRLHLYLFNFNVTENAQFSWLRLDEFLGRTVQCSQCCDVLNIITLIAILQYMIYMMNLLRFGKNIKKQIQVFQNADVKCHAWSMISKTKKKEKFKSDFLDSSVH